MRERGSSVVKEEIVTRRFRQTVKCVTARSACPSEPAPSGWSLAGPALQDPCPRIFPCVPACPRLSSDNLSLSDDRAAQDFWALR
jgi:hypothetical protein